MTTQVASKPSGPNAKGPTPQEVLEVEHFTDRLFRFRMTRPTSFRFRSGEFVMIGLPGPDGRNIMRAYSVASPSWDEVLEFYSIKVPDGPLTSMLDKTQPGDEVLLGKKPTGTLVLDALIPGKRLYMFSTGTGFAPFASVIRDPETYEKFDEVIVTHSCRDVAELTYSTRMVEELKDHEILSEIIGDKLKLFTSCTREDYRVKGRITHLIENGQLFEELGVPPLDPDVDRAMICGSMEMLLDTKQLLIERGFTEGANNAPAQFVIEKAFAD